MLITFKSAATAEIVMYKKHIQELFTVLDKDLDRGVITVDEIEGVIKKIDQYIEDCNSKNDENTNNSDDDKEDNDINFSMQEVNISARLFPLLEMLRESKQKQKNILWGV